MLGCHYSPLPTAARVLSDQTQVTKKWWPLGCISTTVEDQSIHASQPTVQRCVRGTQFSTNQNTCHGIDRLVCVHRTSQRHPRQSEEQRGGLESGLCLRSSTTPTTAAAAEAVKRNTMANRLVAITTHCCTSWCL